MSRPEPARERVRRLIGQAQESPAAMQAALTALADEIDRLHARISQLEIDLSAMSGSLPMTDGDIGRSDETTA